MLQILSHIPSCGVDASGLELQSPESLEAEFRVEQSSLIHCVRLDMEGNAALVGICSAGMGCARHSVVLQSAVAVTALFLFVAQAE